MPCPRHQIANDRDCAASFAAWLLIGPLWVEAGDTGTAKQPLGVDSGLCDLTLLEPEVDDRHSPRL